MNIVNTKYSSTEDMTNKLQEIKWKKIKFFKKINNYYKEMKHKNFGTQQNPFAKNAQGISKIYHEVFLLMKFLQNKPQVKNMNIKYYDFFYNFIKIRKEKDIEEEQYENNFISLNDVIIPNHYIGRKGRGKWDLQ